MRGGKNRKQRVRKTPKQILLITLSHLEPDVDVVQVQVLPRALPALEQLGELVDLGPHLRAGLCVLLLLERVGLGVGRAGDAGRAEVAEARGLPRCRGRGGGGRLSGGRGKGGDLCVRVFVFFVFDVSVRESKRGAERERAEERGLKTLAPKTQGLVARRPRPRRSGARRGGRVPGFDLVPLRASKARAPPATGHFFPPPGIQARFHLPSYGFQSKQENNTPRRTATRNSRAKVTTMLPTTFSRSTPTEKAEPAARASMASGHRLSPQRPRS